MIYYTECQKCDIKWTYTPKEYELYKFDSDHHRCKTCDEQFYRWTKREGLYKTSSGKIVDIDPKHYNAELLQIDRPKPKQKRKPTTKPRCHICKKKFPRSGTLSTTDKIKKHQEKEHGLKFGKICREESRRQFRNRKETHYTINVNNDRILQDQVDRYLYADEMIAGIHRHKTRGVEYRWRKPEIHGISQQQL